MIEQRANGKCVIVTGYDAKQQPEYLKDSAGNIAEFEPEEAHRRSYAQDYSPPRAAPAKAKEK